MVLDIETGKALARRRLSGWIGLVAGWSPDGKLLGYGSIAISNPVGLWIMNVETGQVIQVAEGPFTAPAWSPDGSKLVFDRRMANDCEIWMIETKELAGLSRNQSHDTPRVGNQAKGTGRNDTHK